MLPGSRPFDQEAKRPRAVARAPGSARTAPNQALEPIVYGSIRYHRPLQEGWSGLDAGLGWISPK